METLLRDIHYGIQSLLKRPGFVIIAVVTLGLGIGVNTAIFSLLNTVLLRPLPVAHPEQIVSVAVRAKNDSILAFSYPNYVDFRDRNQVLSGLLLYRMAPLSLSREGNNQISGAMKFRARHCDMSEVGRIADCGLRIVPFRSLLGKQLPRLGNSKSAIRNSQLAIGNGPHENTA
ncbi:MAG TPA: hypothetical protein VJ124_26020 [Pyrinomonadaceae bacterium]|nr:hypothetical protein [Pyrinomonadaceae bacterium]